MTTGGTAPCSYRDPETGALITGCTATTVYFVPNTGITYQFKINLVQSARDIGFFNPYIQSVVPPPPPPPPSGDTYYYLDNNDDIFTDFNGDRFVWEIPI